MKLKTIVTGGAGFIGSHTVDAILALGHHVTVVDNFSTGRPQNLQHQSGNASLKLIEADINDANKTAHLYEGVDWVIHLAALADIVPSIEKPIDYHRSNVEGTVAVLEHARRAGVKRFIYAASSSCYGLATQFPTPEDAPKHPQYPYALTKMIGEQYVLHWAQLYKLPAVSLRFFNVYGPRCRTSGTYGAVFGVFLAQKIHGRPYTIVGDGEQSRDFTFVTDVAAAIIAAAQSDVTGDVFNVGSGNHYTVNQVANLLKGEKVFIPKRPGEPEQTYADIEKIKKVLRWKPKVSLEEGIAEIEKNLSYWKDGPVWTPESISTATKSWFQYLKN
jgi:UDP-glucose 4-epimerase